MHKENTLLNTLNTIDIEDIKRAMTQKYYDDSIILENDKILDLSNYKIDKLRKTPYSLDIPNNNGVYYYDDSLNAKYYFVKNSRYKIESDYMDSLKVHQININYQIDGDLSVKPCVVEYHNNAIIDILETNDNMIDFQPNEQTDEIQILFKLEGHGIVYNIDINRDIRERAVYADRNLEFFEGDFFFNKNIITTTRDNEKKFLNMNVNPNDKKHVYISYLELNNKYTKLPSFEILKGIDLTSNLLIEFNIYKDETLEFLPMLIEYDGKEKIGIKNINIYNPEIVNLKPNTNNVRLAFRVSGYGDIKIKNLHVVSLEKLSDNHKLNFEDRTDVVKLLSPTMKLSEFKIASIMDEFTFNSFNPEVQLYRLDFHKWKSELLFIQPDLLFIESAWVGNNGQWHRKVAYYDDEQHNDIRELIKFAKNLNIPVVFWNKEDPVHYDRFIETAKLCNYIFTTDNGRVKQYIKDCGHTNVDSLPFAAQPKNHNPIKIQKERDPRVSFAGSYYRHHEERSKDMDILLEASKEVGLVIYDRNYEKTKKGQMPNHKYPERYNPYIKGSLPFNLIDKSYKGYKYMINVNTVKYSETMFSRRVFEGLLSGTPIISTYSLGMKKMFGDIINSSNSIDELRNHLKTLNENEELYNKYALRGVREVLLNHTYEKRMMKILNKVGYTTLSNNTNVYFLAFIESIDELDRYLKIYESQTVLNKKLVIIHKNIKNYSHFYNTYNTEDIIGIDYNVLKKYTNIRQLLGKGFISVLNNDDFYGENYALDLLLAKDYSNADIIGKSMYYKKVKNDIKIYNKHNDYIFTNNVKVTRSIINVTVFDKFSVESTLQFLEGFVEFDELTPFGPKVFSADSLNYIEDGYNFHDKQKVQV